MAVPNWPHVFAMLENNFFDVADCLIHFCITFCRLASSHTPQVLSHCKYMRLELYLRQFARIERDKEFPGFPEIPRTS